MMTRSVSAYMINMIIFWLILSGTTVLPSFVANFVGIESTFYINIALFLVTLAVYSYEFLHKRASIGKLLNENYSMLLSILYFFIIIEIVSAAYSGYGAKSSIYVIANFAIFVIITKMILIDCQDIDKTLRTLMKPYVYYSLYVATTGFLAFLALRLDMVDSGKWQFVNEFMKKADEGQGGQLLYSMPLYLSFVLSGADIFSLFGIDIIRVCGLSHEPHVAAFMTAPFLFMINYYFEHRRRAKIYSFTITILYIFALASLTAFFSLIATFSIFLLKQSRKALGILMLVSLLILGLKITACDTFSENTKRKHLLTRMYSLSSNPILKTNIYALSTETNLLGYGLFAAREGLGYDEFYEKRGMVDHVYHLLLTAIFIFVAIFFYFKQRVYPEFSLFIIYVLIHSFKSPFHIYYYPIISYYFVLFSIWVSRKTEDAVPRIGKISCISYQ